MAWGKRPVKVGDTFSVGPVDFLTEAIANIAPERFTKQGVELVNERMEVFIPMNVEPYVNERGEHDGIGEDVHFTVTVRIVRAATSQAELDAVTAAADEQNGRQAQRKAEEADRLAKEKESFARLALQMDRESRNNAARDVQIGQAAARLIQREAAPTTAATAMPQRNVWGRK